MEPVVEFSLYILLCTPGHFYSRRPLLVHGAGPQAAGDAAGR